MRFSESRGLALVEDFCCDNLAPSDETYIVIPGTLCSYQQLVKVLRQPEIEFPAR